MENSPQLAETDSKESDQKKSKRAEALGAILVEPNEQDPERSIAPEANQLHGKQLPPEHIGHVLVSTESDIAKPSPPTTEREKAINRRVETMSRTELMNISENIAIEGTDLRRIYETHLVSERGLRRIIEEYLEGGDVMKLLRLELLQREIDFERDPALRDQARKAKSGKTQSARAELSYLLKRAGVIGVGDETSLVSLNINESSRAEQHSLQIRHRRIMDIGFISIILILLILVIILVINRS